LYKILITSLLILLCGRIEPSFGSPVVFRVVIDPGHGGADEGTVYRHGRARVAEKTVTLSLARKVAHQLMARGFNVSLTRNSDIEVPLPDRTSLANRLAADVFISIHMNSTEANSLSDPEGVETFILNNATDASSRRLARLENSVITTQLQESPDQLVDVALILKDLRLDGNLWESKRLACHVQGNLIVATSPPKTRAHRNRGVKQALFHVLLGADMPSILVEAGFLSNAHDREILLSQKGQAKISQAIADAVDHYRQHKNSTKDLSTLGMCKVN
jgi:N-acetylmuramoyl-L-alanine amidase